MTVKRAERVGPLLAQEISRLLISKLEDPGLKGVTITKVKMTADLKIARVYFSLIGDDRAARAAAEAFDRAKKIIRRAIGDNLELRYLPELEFFLDKNPAYADRIDQVIHEIHHRQRGSVQDAAAFIQKYDSFIIAAHVNPEGDAIGATLGLLHVLRAIGKTATPYNHDPVPPATRFFPGTDEIIHDTTALPPADAVIVLDSGDRDRPGPEFKIFMNDRTVLNIDHHATNTRFGDVNWVDDQASSTGEMIARLAPVLDARVTPEAAICLYTAILTDSGSFHFSNTSAATLHAAADMVAAGAQPDLAANQYYHSKPPAYLLLLSEFLGSLHFNPDHARAEAALTLEQYQRTQTGPAVSENFINFLTDVATVKVAVFYRENRDREWKVSLRSKGDVNVAQVAQELGGGGHPNAAGATVAGDLDQVRQLVRDRVDPLL